MKTKKHKPTPTEQTVISIAAKYAECLAEDITLDSRWREDLGLDSIDDVDVVMECEETFGIELPNEYLYAIETVGELVELIESRSDGTL